MDFGKNQTLPKMYLTILCLTVGTDCYFLEKHPYYMSASVCSRLF